tara:strand:- start:282 stop:464 length:183 start_codon:yes stop_codon:yes gene_type:complete
MEKHLLEKLQKALQAKADELEKIICEVGASTPEEISIMQSTMEEAQLRAIAMEQWILNKE